MKAALKTASTATVSALKAIGTTLRRWFAWHQMRSVEISLHDAYNQLDYITDSEMLPEGCKVKCGITILPGEISEEVLTDLLDYGFYSGLGQWRNGGFGRFRYELKKED